jgi:hypothetical protein
MYICSIFILFSSAPSPAPGPSSEFTILIPIYEHPETTNPLDPDNIFGLQFKFEGGNIKQIYLTLCSGAI